MVVLLFPFGFLLFLFCCSSRPFQPTLFLWFSLGYFFFHYYFLSNAQRRHMQLVVRFFSWEDGCCSGVCCPVFGKRKGHLLSPLAFIPLLNERGWLGASYHWFLSSYWVIVWLVISSIIPPRISQFLPPPFSLKQVGLSSLLSS